MNEEYKKIYKKYRSYDSQLLCTILKNETKPKIERKVAYDILTNERKYSLSDLKNISTKTNNPESSYELLKNINSNIEDIKKMFTLFYNVLQISLFILIFIVIGYIIIFLSNL